MTHVPDLFGFHIRNRKRRDILEALYVMMRCNRQHALRHTVGLSNPIIHLIPENKKPRQKALVSVSGKTATS
jgi:hypothetical protein